MDIIVRQFNVIGLRAEFPKCFTKNVYVYVDSRDQQSLRMLARKKRLTGFSFLKSFKAWYSFLDFSICPLVHSAGNSLPFSITLLVMINRAMS